MEVNFTCDRCGVEGRELSLYDIYSDLSYDLCESCADDFETFMDGEE